MSEWRPSRPVSLAQAREWIGALLPGAAVEPYAAGWDNAVYRADRQWIFRFPQRHVAVAPMEHEIALLPALSLPFPIPEPVFVGRSPDGWPFAGYREIRGAPVPIANPSEAERARWATSLAHFVRALHDHDLPHLRTLGLPEQSEIRRDWRARVDRVRLRLDQIGLDAAPFARWLDLPPPGDPLRVVHGDLHARHLLVENDVTGVIDWGDLHAGDPAMDLAIAMCLPADAQTIFRAAYGPVAEETWQRARFEALYQAVALVAWARDINDEDLLREVQYTLRGIASS